MSFARAERRRAWKAAVKADRREQVRLAQLMADHARSRRIDHENRLWRESRKRVVPLRPGQPDLRDDKYLHSHARGMRGFVNALAASGR